MYHLGQHGEEAAKAMVNMALNSKSFWALIPLQDLLGLDDQARMNRPGTLDGNWIWRSPEGALSPALAKAVQAMIAAADRVLV